MNFISSVVVLYNPAKDTLDNLKIISSISRVTYAVINSCSDEILHELGTLNVTIINNGSNIGLAKALNIGIREALHDSECKFVALFDQDSMPEKNMLLSLEKCFEGTSKLATAGPYIQDVKHKTAAIQSNVIDVDVVITSGSLTPVNVFKEVGLMDETLFIDYIDYEWCLRASYKGYRIVVVRDAVLNHNLGDTLIKFAGMSKPMHHNTIRQYYIIRNQLIMLSRNYIPVKWKFKTFLKLFYRIPGYIVYSDNKLKTIQMISKGIKDFFVNYKEHKTVKY